MPELDYEPGNIEKKERSQEITQAEKLQRLIDMKLIPKGSNDEIPIEDIVRRLLQKNTRSKEPLYFNEELLRSVDLSSELKEVTQKLIHCGIPEELVEYTTKQILRYPPFFSDEDSCGYDGHISYNKKRGGFTAHGGIDISPVVAQSISKEISVLLSANNISQDEVIKLTIQMLLAHEFGHALIDAALLIQLNTQNITDSGEKQINIAEDSLTKLVDKISPNKHINRLKKIGKHTSWLSFKTIAQERVAEGIMMIVFADEIKSRSSTKIQEYLTTQTKESDELLSILEKFAGDGGSVQNLMYTSWCLSRNYPEVSSSIVRLGCGQIFGYANPLNQDQLAILFSNLSGKKTMI